MGKIKIIAGIAISILAGVGIGYAALNSQYSAKFDKLKKAFPNQGAIMSVTGTIKGISGNVLTVESSPEINPFVNMPAVRKITIASNVYIIKRVPKDDATIQREISDFQKQMQKTVPAGATSTAIQPPLPYNEIPLSASDLKTGSIIIAEADKDIGTAAAFDAIKISIIGIPAANGVPPASINGTATTNTSAPANSTGTTPSINRLQSPPAPTARHK